MSLDETVKCIGAFRQLRALHVRCHLNRGRSAAARIKCLLSILSIIGSSALQSLAIRLQYNRPYNIYHVDRVGLLDSLCSAEMVQVFNRFSALRNLSFTLYDNTPEHDRQWWEAELATRLQSRLCSARVSVSVIRVAGAFPASCVSYDRVAQLTSQGYYVRSMGWREQSLRGSVQPTEGPTKR